MDGVLEKCIPHNDDVGGDDDLHHHHHHRRRQYFQVFEDYYLHISTVSKTQIFIFHLAK